MNKYTGVLGVYNCQGAAWNSAERKNTFHPTNSDSLTGSIRVRDVHFIREASTDPEWVGNCAIYSHKTGDLVILPYNSSLPVSLHVLEHDIFTVTPVKTFPSGLLFAPLGLINMYNAGGAIEGLSYDDGVRRGVVTVELKGCGQFGCYSSSKPTRCFVGSEEVDFGYDSCSGLLTLSLDRLPEEGQRVHVVEVEVS